MDKSICLERLTFPGRGEKMSGVINIEQFRDRPLFELDRVLTPEQLAGLDRIYLTRGVETPGERRGEKGTVPPRLYDLLKRFGWEEAGLGISVEALIEVSVAELVESTRVHRWYGGQYGLGPTGLKELQAALTSLIASE